MRTCVAIGLAVLGLVVGRSSTAIAQDSVLAELYGYGVHAYFAGDYDVAHEFLTTAIDQGTLDPRVYYFRGLAYTRLGRPDEAKADYQKGAGLETTGADRVYPIGRSLQRVQGRSRLEVERHRQMARLTSRTRDMKAKQARYEQLKNAEGEVLRDPNRPAPAPAKELVGTPPASDESDPFGDDSPAETAGPAVVPATPEPAPGDDVFGDDPAMPEPATPMPVTPMPAEPDPFGGDDPFGSDPAPAGGAPADDTEDPFGDDAPADMPAASDDDDPFS